MRSPLNPVHADVAPRIRSDRARRVLTWVAMIAALTAVLALWWCNAGAQGRAVRALPEQERRDLYTHIVKELAGICTRDAEVMSSYCGNQARMALAFPECDHACEVLAWQQLSRGQMPR